MTIELYLSRVYETAHEMQALGHLLGRMLQVYGQDDTYYFVFANFFCQGEEIDLAVLKRDAVVVVELKDAGGPVTGGENGPWTGTNPDGTTWTLNDHRRRNPYQQVRDYRFAVMKQLKADVPTIMVREKAEHQRLDHVSTVVAFCPTLHPKTQINVPSSRWFQVTGLDELPQVIYFLRSPSLDFRQSELRKLAAKWGLTQFPLDHFVATAQPVIIPAMPSTTPASVPPPTPVAQATGLAPASAPGIAGLQPGTSPVPPPAPAVQPVSTPPQRAPVEQPVCLVCRYLPTPCAVPYLRGTIQPSLPLPGSAQNAGQLTIRLDGTHTVTLKLTEHWQHLLPLINRVIAQLQREPVERLLDLAAYHLTKVGDSTYTAGPTSLVVLEPDWLINVTDLTKVEFCPREYLSGRFRLPEPGQPKVRGTIVHRVFEQIIRTPFDDDAIRATLRPAARDQVRDLAVLNLTRAAINQDVITHYNRLRRWAKAASLPTQTRSETFLLAPALGMKGKIDALWSGDGSRITVAELKTGKSQGGKAKPGHAFQAGAYGLMTAVGASHPAGGVQARLLYTGNDELSGSLNIERQVPLTPDLFRGIVDQRNRLVLIDYLADAPFELNPNKCRNCSMGEFCEEMAVLLGHNDPRPAELRQRFAAHQRHAAGARTWFQTYNDLLMREYRAVKESHAALWRMAPEDRANQGTAVILTGCTVRPEPTERGAFLVDFSAHNQSELREDDHVLTSDENGPLGGVIAEGDVRRVQETGLTVEFDERLEFEPRYLDKYVSEGLLERQFAALPAWLHLEPGRRDLVLQHLPPRFPALGDGLRPSPPPRPHFPPMVGMRQLNPRQQQAVEQALNLEDYLIIHGPPGSGKTTLVVAIVREYLHQGKRVMLAAGTNTAVDNMLKALMEAGFSDQLLRLGSFHRTDPALRGLIPEQIADADDLDTYITQMRHALTARPVVATTCTSWMNGAWDALYDFDLAIVDEAAQLTVPLTLGPLRLARSFILIGDHMQLPAVVLSETGRRSTDPEESGPTRLSTPLFKQLYTHLKEGGLPGIVKLNDQYRMNEEICAIPREIWYDDDLKPANNETAHARLAVIPDIHPTDPLFPILDPNRPVVFVDLPWAAGAGAPRTNRAEAELVREIVRSYMGHAVGSEAIGIIAPFRAQVTMIRRVLEARFPEKVTEIRAMVDTVDRFQGQQRELIIISLATHGDLVHDLLQDERRLNVALTRAKHKLIILGDAAVLKSHPAYYSLIRHCTVIPAPTATRGWPL